jgi:hypothetical protein
VRGPAHRFRLGHAQGSHACILCDILGIWRTLSVSPAATDKIAASILKRGLVL